MKKQRIKKIIQFIANPRLWICLGLAWMITNGWSYLLLGLGVFFDVEWMIALASGYLAFLWLPVSPEKLATLAIAIFLLRLLFPRDEKTLAILRRMKEALTDRIRRKKKKTDHKPDTEKEKERRPYEGVRSEQDPGRHGGNADAVGGNEQPDRPDQANDVVDGGI